MGVPSMWLRGSKRCDMPYLLGKPALIRWIIGLSKANFVMGIKS
jgi:hypothetical protein